MDNYHDSLDQVFPALGDPTRRAVVSRLVTGPASVTELAAPCPIALPSFMKHLGVLERSGLIQSQKEGRTRTCELAPGALLSADQWMTEHRSAYVEPLRQKENPNEH